ncbi:MAG: hypothetical protein KatS3mg084_0631 [Candidatus Dojkabacteria bacterium]|nr:MAG: hypothetical protein KatS3mg084_0631 [Candidatus Dojkabacteria bacterium]
MQVSRQQRRDLSFSMKASPYYQKTSRITTVLRWITIILIIFAIVCGAGASFYLTQHRKWDWIFVGDVADAIVYHANSLLDREDLFDVSLQSSSSIREFNETNLSYFSNEELAKLGILNLPENFQIQDTYKGIRFVRTAQKSFSEIQLGLLKYFIDITPTRLLNPGPTAIVTYAPGEIANVANLNDRTAAFASGSYMFFNDHSFNPVYPLADTSVDAAFRTFIHELVHVAQFNYIVDRLDPASIDEFYKEGLSWIDLVVNSQLIAEFALYAGWQVYSEGSKLLYKLPNSVLAQTSEYGKSKIYEDMAESVAAFVTTNTVGFSGDRLKWCVQFLGDSDIQVKLHKFPVPFNMQSVNITNPSYDKNKESSMKQRYKYLDIQYFITEDVNVINDIQYFLSEELSQRGWKGTFTRYRDQNGVVYIKGDFDGTYRDLYLELYTYDHAHGFLVKPRGTIMVVMSGYLLKD